MRLTLGRAGVLGYHIDGFTNRTLSSPDTPFSSNTMSNLKQRLAKNELCIVAALGRMPHHNIVQMIGMRGGFHGMWFDLEHMDYTTETLEVLTLASRAHGLDSFVRLPPTDYAVITRALEAGTGGIMAAQVRTAAQAEEIVRWSKFFPRGCRGLNLAGYDAGFAGMAPMAFTQQANRDTLVAIQIETLEALEDVEKIAAIDGVDLIFLGPADMSQSLGVTGDFTNPKCLAAIDKISAACKKAGKPWGVVPVNADYATLCVDKGCRMLSICHDVKLLNLGIEAAKQQYAKFLS